LNNARIRRGAELRGLSRTRVGKVSRSAHIFPTCTLPAIVDNEPPNCKGLQ
jgi:hypothetical protein